MHELLQSPFKIEDILKKKKKIKRELMQSESSISIKIAILGGATTNLIKEVLELFLLDAGITPVFMNPSIINGMRMLFFKMMH